MGMADLEVLQSLVEFIYLGHCSIVSAKEVEVKLLALQLGVDIGDHSEDTAGQICAIIHGALTVLADFFGLFF